MKPTRQLHDPGQNLLTAGPALFDKAIGGGIAGMAPQLDYDSSTHAPIQRCRQLRDTRA